MNVYILPFDFSDEADNFTAVHLIPKLIEFAKRNSVAKVLVQRPVIYSTNSRSHKPIAQVNCDAFVKFLNVRGLAVGTIHVEPVIVKSSSEMILANEKAITDKINECKEDCIVMPTIPYSGRRPNLFGNNPPSSYPKNLKGHKIIYISQGEI